ncbi:hypothetical protein Tco_1178538, partial [Tanacetum coccineum]
MHKCGKNDLPVECLTLAEAYAKGDQFSDSLSVCKSEKLFDKELKEHVSFKSKDLEEVDQEFLENCALGYHEILLLKEESGHFLENAELVRSSGALLKEVDLLEKAGKFQEASLLLLWSPRGEILLIRKILDKHLQMNSLNYDWEDKLPVDIYTFCEDKMIQNRVSIRTLVFYWNLWKKHISDILRIVESLEKEEPFKASLHADFCLYYFGVRKQFLKGNTVYLSLNKDADWISNTCKKGLQSDEKHIHFDGREMVSAIWSYWQSQLLFVGIK